MSGEARAMFISLMSSIDIHPFQELSDVWRGLPMSP